MPSPIKKAFVKSLLFLLAGLQRVGRVLLSFFWLISWPLRLLWKVVLRPLAFWLYQVLLRAKISTGRVLPPVRRTFFIVFGHRYVVHGMMAVIIVFVTTTNVSAYDAELGEESTQSLMYEIVQQSIGTDDFAADDAIGYEGEAFSYLDAEFGSATSASATAEVAGGNDGSLTYDRTGVASPYTLPSDDGLAEEPIQIARPSIHIVQEGETISAIAKKYGISINTVLWANDMTARSLIRPGQELTVLPVSGVLHVVKRGETLGAIAKKYDTDVEKILAANLVKDATQVQIGHELVIPDGRPPAAPAPKPAPKPPTRIASVTDIFKPPSEAPPSAAVAGTDIVWPTDQKRINQYYKWRHTGVDINGTLQNAVYAVDAGIVTFSGWNKSGYGNMILIDHGNGMVTRYAHHSKHFVQAGDQVTKGQSIAMVGSTGRSTGPHLHFEIYVSGKRVNPLDYYR